MDYAVPRILHQAGMLERLYTDLCAAVGLPRYLKMLPRRLRAAPVQRIINRVPKGIPAEAITAFNGLGYAYALKRAQARNATETARTYLWANRSFCRRVCESDWGQARGAYTFNCAALEILQRARADGLKAVVEQTMAPHAALQELLRKERELHPGWEVEMVNHVASEYSAREQEEWRVADLIVCGSEFVRQGIAECNGPAEKCRIVPYGIDPASTAHVSGKSVRQAAPSGTAPKLRVLTVGAVGLRKGAPYLLDAARQLKAVAEFRWVGQVRVLPEAERQLRGHVHLVGSVPKNQIGQHYDWADVFLLPSICEGSATVTYEALASGLPVICTPNTGAVVRDGADGFTVPIRDSAGIVERIEQLNARRELLASMSQNARERAQEFSLEAYGKRLIGALN
jgi:glycosyltransferase involved in cell wall biosynthesis